MEGFDKRERRAILIFLPLVLAIAVGMHFTRALNAAHTVEKIEAEEHPLPADSIGCFSFDPNTVVYDDLLRLGFSKTLAVQLLKYRAAGKTFRIPEELATLYGMPDSLFRRLRPWVTIGEESRYHPQEHSYPDYPPPHRRTFRGDRPFRIDTVSAAYIRSLGFSTAWSEAFVRCCRRRPMHSPDELREIDFIGDSITELLTSYLLFPEREPDPYDQPVELNTADSASLRSVYGIGARTAHAIVVYRRRLGGFHRVEQLAEVPGILESNYEKIIEQISCDSFHIQKIDINFAPSERLRDHPYVSSEILKRLLSKRQQRKSKGGWSTVEELVDENILTEEEAARLRPYLLFGTQQNE